MGKADWDWLDGTGVNVKYGAGPSVPHPCRVGTGAKPEPPQADGSVSYFLLLTVSALWAGRRMSGCLSKPDYLQPRHVQSDIAESDELRRRRPGSGTTQVSSEAG